jgi:dienelactone hydrolase
LGWRLFAGTLLFLLGASAVGAAEPANPEQMVGKRLEFVSAARGKDEHVWGYLSVPSASSKKYPLMLILHSSGGVHDRDWFFARTLNEMGVATFVIDSFAPRGLMRVFENKLIFQQREQAVDALYALDALEGDTRIDFARLGVMGRSMGGEAALRLSLIASRDQLPKQSRHLFSLVLAIMPGCMSQQSDRHVTTGTEVHFYLAEKDFSPARDCIVYANRMKGLGASVDYVVYPNTFHVFDSGAQPTWSPTQEVFADCANERFRPDFLIRLDSGQIMRSKDDLDMFFAACVRHGAWIGGNPESMHQLDGDWIATVKRRWLGG